MVNTDSTSNINMFGGQQMTAEDFAAISKMAVQQAEQTKKLQKIQQKALDDKVAQLKGESEAEQRARKLREARELAQKKYDDETIVEFDKKLKKNKESKVKNEQLQKLKDESSEKEKKSVTEKLKNSSLLNVLPDNIKNAKPKDDGEQKNLGESIQRVSFHPEGIKILRTLLEPIYKSLNAFTDDMDKGLKSILEKIDITNKKGFGWGTLLLGILSDLIFSANKLKDSFKWFMELPSKFIKLLQDEGLYKFADYKAWFELRWEKYVSAPFNKLLKTFNLEEPFAKLTTKISNFGKNLSKFLELDETGVWIAAKFQKYIVNPIKDSFEMLKSFKNYVGNFFSEYIIEPIKNGIEIGKNISRSLGEFFEPLLRPFKMIGNLFADAGETASGFMKTFGGVFEYIKTFEGPLQKLLAFARPFLGILEFVGKLFSVELLAVISGVWEAVETFFDVFKDDKLSFIQKAVSIFAGFIGGIASLVSDTLGMMAKILSYIPGLGWASKGLDYLAKLTDTHNLGKKTADMFRDSNEPKDPVKDAYKSGAKYQNATPEEKKKMDAQQDAMEHKNQHFVQQGKDKSKGIYVDNDTSKPQDTPQSKSPEVKPVAPAIVAQPEPAPSEPQYQPKPHDIELRSEINGNLDKVIASNERILNKVDGYLDYVKKSNNDIINGPKTVINNSSQVSQHDDTKDYLMKPVRDTNYDKKMSWYGNSLNYRATLP